MKYLSVCSGIEAASVAWHDLGWTPVAFSEIEPFPSSVLKHHYPHVPNVGDMTKFKEWNLEPIDLLVGGTPCQSFSVAGLRKGLDDPRGNLMLTFLAIAERERPKWIVWENVPGVLSSNGGRDFGTFLGALGELGYGWAYRVLDAQWFGVAQRRRRVFVVGCLGDQAGAAAVLFESESVRRDTPPSREKGQGAARGVASGTYLGNAEGGAAGVPYLTCSNINAHINNQTPLVGESVAQPVAHALRGEGFDASEDGTGRGTPIVPVACATGDRTHALTTRSAAEEDGTGRGTPIVPVAQPVAIAFKVRGGVEREDGSRGITNIGKQAGKGYLGRDELAFTVASSPDQWVAQPAMQVRRLTPVECERLQGFPDGYTNIPWRKKDEAPDGPRYKALGNSMAVPCMKWIGERIQAATARQEVQP